MSQCPPECQGQLSGSAMEDDGLEPGDTIYAAFIPPEWEEHYIGATDTPSQWLAQEAQRADPLRTWCQFNTATSEMSSPKRPLMSSHCGRHGTMPLTLPLGLNSLAPRHSPCPLWNRWSLMTSSARTLQMATSIHPSPPWEPLCSSSRRRTAHLPHTGLLEVEQDHGQELLPPPPRL